MTSKHLHLSQSSSTPKRLSESGYKVLYPPYGTYAGSEALAGLPVVRPLPVPWVLFQGTFSGEWRLAGSEVGIQILLLSKLTGSSLG
jgi:hypothetical protein